MVDLAARALLIVDVQVDFCEGGSLAVTGGAQVATGISSYLADHHGDYALVLASRDWHTPGSTNGGHIALPPEAPDYRTTWPVHCIAETPGADYHPALELTWITHHVRKGMGRHGYSAFEGQVQDGTTMSALLRESGVSSLSVVGIATDHCVRASGLDARREGFDVTVLTPLVAGVDPDASNRALEELATAGAVLE